MMNGSSTPMWPSLLPPLVDQLWFTADYPKNEEAELQMLEEELEQEKLLLREQTNVMNEITLERVDEEQEYDETEDDSYMGDNGSDDVDIEPQSPPW